MTCDTEPSEPEVPSGPSEPKGREETPQEKKESEPHVLIVLVLILLSMIVAGNVNENLRLKGWPYIQGSYEKPYTMIGNPEKLEYVVKKAMAFPVELFIGRYILTQEELNETETAFGELIDSFDGSYICFESKCQLTECFDENHVRDILSFRFAVGHTHNEFQLAQWIENRARERRINREFLATYVFEKFKSMLRKSPLPTPSSNHATDKKKETPPEWFDEAVQELIDSLNCYYKVDFTECYNEAKIKELLYNTVYENTDGWTNIKTAKWIYNESKTRNIDQKYLADLVFEKFKSTPAKSPCLTPPVWFDSAVQVMINSLDCDYKVNFTECYDEEKIRYLIHEDCFDPWSEDNNIKIVSLIKAETHSRSVDKDYLMNLVFEKFKSMPVREKPIPQKSPADIAQDKNERARALRSLFNNTSPLEHSLMLASLCVEGEEYACIDMYFVFLIYTFLAVSLAGLVGDLFLICTCFKKS
jgi:hypothetical protein